MTANDERQDARNKRPTMLIYCPDLMFASRLRNLARHAGVRAVIVNPGQPVEGGDLLVASFGSGGNWEQAIREAAGAGIPAVAFGPHVDAESRRIAKAAGAFRAVNNGNLERALIPVLQALAGGEPVRGALASVTDAEPGEPHEN